MATRAIRIVEKKPTKQRSTSGLFQEPYYVERSLANLTKKMDGIPNYRDVLSELILLISLVSAGGQNLYHRTNQKVTQSKKIISNLIKAIDTRKRRIIIKALVQFFRNVEYWAYVKQKDITKAKHMIDTATVVIGVQLFYYLSGNTLMRDSIIAKIKHKTLSLMKKIEKRDFKSGAEAITATELLIQTFKEELVNKVPEQHKKNIRNNGLVPKEIGN